MRLIRLAGAATGGVVIVGALGLAILMAGDGGFSGSTGALVRWYVPILLGVAVAALVWVGLSEADSDDTDLGMGADSCCGACGGAIHSEWRLCPHCGERLPGTKTC
jgi:hypothetical protein